MNAGAASDLIEDKYTGYIVDYKDIEKVSAIIEDIIDNPLKYEEMGKRSSDFIRKNVSLELAAASFLKAAQKVVLHK
jgi:glycosyltransferase involved in cell wall biosynthesis